jgi:hypothetical protein
MYRKKGLPCGREPGWPAGQVFVKPPGIGKTGGGGWALKRGTEKLVITEGCGLFFSVVHPLAALISTAVTIS